MDSTDTIVALATPLGKGGVGIIRISGKHAYSIGTQIVSSQVSPRIASYLTFKVDADTVIDQGIALYFKSPHSFTGEDVFELQGHGGPVVLDMLLKRCIELGARMAKPGEFSERAFLNDKMDLAQAEAISDLINASSAQAVKSAVKSMQGEFSLLVNNLVEELIHLRLYVEAAIDFPEEEIDFLSDGKVSQDINRLIASVEHLQNKAQQGALLRDGMNVVLAGKPNAGKSSLLNALAGKESAIVTDIPGTTRDVLREYIHIDGMPLHITDTAGLRESDDHVEKIGIERALQEINTCDRLLLVIDSTEINPLDQAKQTVKELKLKNSELPPVTFIMNKSDLSGLQEKMIEEDNQTIIFLAAKQKLGLDLLTQHLKHCMGYESQQEGVFIARRRHLDAIEKAKNSILNGQRQLLEFNAGELLAEELRLAQLSLNEITGEFSADDLLGRIFSSFCIGK